MACCALIAALFGSAVRRFRRVAEPEVSVATAHWSPEEGRQSFRSIDAITRSRSR
jgi:hypothetical protein